MEIFFSILLGVSLAAAAGFRVFIPLLAISLAIHFEMVPIADSWSWLGSGVAVILFAVATFIETGAYFIPWLDNMLDVIAVPLAGIAGTLLMVAVVGDLDPVFLWALGIVAGGGTAAAVSGTTSTSRLASTATTGGLANPVIAGAETGAAITVSTASLLSPILGVFLLLLILYGITKLFRYVKRRRSY